MDREMLKKNFEKHGFSTSFFDTCKAAVAYLKEQIQGETVAMGGSMTLKEMELDKVLAERNEVIWHWNTPGMDTLKKATGASIYVSSANGVAATGELINIDGNGNRVAMTLFGPRKVYFVVGKNKICPDLSGALTRAREVAAPKNVMRLEKKLPCRAAGGDTCYDCNSPERICRATVILERPCALMEVEVVFIDQELGY
ncbi:MAG: LUD domain-containing protein [Lachnospiraceae bacterium]|nr:LUD domain-containing protein [Lachnospiraceae bacterium]